MPSILTVTGHCNLLRRTRFLSLLWMFSSLLFSVTPNLVRYPFYPSKKLLTIPRTHQSPPSPRLPIPSSPFNLAFRVLASHVVLDFAIPPWFELGFQIQFPQSLFLSSKFSFFFFPCFRFVSCSSVGEKLGFLKIRQKIYPSTTRRFCLLCL